jgi:hypothetical protein
MSGENTAEPAAGPEAPTIGSPAWQRAEADRMTRAWADATPTPTHIQRRESQAKADLAALSEIVDGQGHAVAELRDSVVEAVPGLRSELEAGAAARERVRELEWSKAETDAEASAHSVIEQWEFAEADEGDLGIALADLGGRVGIGSDIYRGALERVAASDFQAAFTANEHALGMSDLAARAREAAVANQAAEEQQRQIQRVAEAIENLNREFTAEHPEVARYASAMNELAEESGLARTGDPATDSARLNALLAASKELDADLAGSAAWQAREQAAMLNTTEALRARIKSPAEMARFTTMAQARGLTVDQATGLVGVPVQDVIERTLERAEAPGVAEVHAQAQENVIAVGAVGRDLQGQLRRNRALRDQGGAPSAQTTGPLPDLRPPRETEWDKVQREYAGGRRTAGLWWETPQ